MLCVFCRDMGNIENKPLPPSSDNLISCTSSPLVVKDLIKISKKKRDTIRTWSEQMQYVTKMKTKGVDLTFFIHLGGKIAKSVTRHKYKRAKL